jgi:hypothetical protein
MSDVKKVKDDLDGSISQTITKFVDKEINIDSTLTSFQHIGDTTGIVSINNLTSGEWTGSFNFKIKLHTHSFNETIESEATFSNEGSSKYSCEECGFFANKTIPIKQAKTCFGDYTWDEIQEICKNGLAKEYFGEYIKQEKTIALGSMDTMEYVYTGNPNNDISSLASQTATIALADIADDGTSITCIFTSYEKQTPYYYMNLNDTNEGGWKSTAMRAWLNNAADGSFYNALPSDLQKAITTHNSTYSTSSSTSTVDICQDKIWLLSEKEVGYTNRGENWKAYEAETQLAYFSNNNDRIRYNSSEKETAIYWWLRSSCYNGSNYFGGVYISDMTCWGDAYYTFGVFPAFDIG